MTVTDLKVLNQKLTDHSMRLMSNFKVRFPENHKFTSSDRLTIIADKSSEFTLEDKKLKEQGIPQATALELLIHKRALDNTKQMLKELSSEKIPLKRPNDFFAEMFKPDKHMKLIGKKLEGKRHKIIKQEQKYKNRLQKKFQKGMRHQQLVTAAKEKQQTLKAIEEWKGSIRRKEGKNLDDFVNEEKNKKFQSNNGSAHKVGRRGPYSSYKGSSKNVMSQKSKGGKSKFASSKSSNKKPSKGKSKNSPRSNKISKPRSNKMRGSK